MAAFGCSRPVHADEDAPGEFVEAKVVYQWLKEGTCLAVDAREPNELENRETGVVLPGAMNIGAGEFMFPKKSFDAKLAPLRASSKRIVCYTEFGQPESRCGLICSALVEQKDFEPSRMYRLKEGLKAWRAMGYDLEKWQSAAWEQSHAAMFALPGQQPQPPAAAVSAPAAVKLPDAPTKPAPPAPANVAPAPPMPAPAIQGAPPKAAGEEAAGRGVWIEGLESAAGRKINGQQGTVLSWDGGKGRYVLRLRSSGSELALRAANLRLMPHRN